MGELEAGSGGGGGAGSKWDIYVHLDNTNRKSKQNLHFPPVGIRYPSTLNSHFILIFTFCRRVIPHTLCPLVYCRKHGMGTAYSMQLAC